MGDFLMRKLYTYNLSKHLRVSSNASPFTNPVRIVALSLILCLTLSVNSFGITITQSNIVIPAVPGDTLSFDLTVVDAAAVVAMDFQTTFSVTGPGGLTFDVAATQNVATDPDYWIRGNSSGISAVDLGENNYQFTDEPDNPDSQALVNGIILARYVFNWNGTLGTYTFTLDENVSKSFLVTSPGGEIEPLQLDSFTVVPEPASITLFAFAAMYLLTNKKP